MPKSTLLIIDIQNDYFPNGKMELFEAESASKKAQLLLKKFRSDNLPIIHIQHVAVSPNATFFLPNTEGVNIHTNVEPIFGEEIMVKNYPNSFRDTGLLPFLQENKIENLIVCGMMTHMCIDTTVRAGNDLGFKIILIHDACATKNIEFNGKVTKAKDVQTAFLGALDGSFCEIISTEKYLETN
jgi:nicotinamidase-related amidase